MTDDFASDFSLNFHIDSNFYHNATKARKVKLHVLLIYYVTDDHQQYTRLSL
jgi:hypothetical protein